MRLAAPHVATTLLYVCLTASLTYGCGGLHQSSLLPTLIFFLGAAAVWLGSVVQFIIAVRAAWRRHLWPASISATAALLGFGSPFLVRGVLHALARQAQLRDLRSAGLDSLRAEVRALTIASRGRSYQPRWFGREVPAAELPPGLRRLSAGAAYTSVSEDGVVLVTDGWGSWRGGFLITPSGSDFVPEGATRVAKGVFYVTAR